MPNTNELDRFEDDLKASEELRKKLDETLKRIVDEGALSSDGEVMVAAAAELGYTITVADLERATAEAQAEDMDDAELEGVSGGWNGLLDLREDEHGHDEWCLAVWHCFTISLHTESNERYVSCWSDYNCKGLYEHYYSTK